MKTLKSVINYREDCVQFVKDLKDAFPEFETDEPIDGAELIDWVAKNLPKKR